MGYFSTLPTELQRLIISHCDTPTKATLARASPDVLTIVREELYRCIELGSHNSNIKAPVEVESDRYVPPDFARRLYSEFEKDVFRRQNLLIRTIRSSPKYGLLVRELYWTIIDTISVYGHPARKVTPAEVENYDKYDVLPELYLPSDKPLWNTFRNFSRALRVDVGFIRDWREITLSPPLFPLARSIRLVGMMTREFAGRILNHNNISGLEQLSLDNLKIFCNLDPPPPPNLTMLELMEYQANNDDFTGSGIARDVLSPLIGRCDSLKCLRLSVYGPYGWSEEDGEGHLRYLEIANFLRSVRPTLQSLYFEQGLDGHFEPLSSVRIPPLSSCGTNRVEPHPCITHCSMDEFFVKLIYPALIESPWPQLRWVEIRGAGNWACCSFADGLPFPKTEIDADPVLNLTGTLYEISVYHRKKGHMWCGFREDTKDDIRRRLGDKLEHLVIEPDPLRDYDYDRRTGIPSTFDIEDYAEIRE